MSLKQADFARKRQDSAHRRYVTAIGALATVRKQLGVAGGSPDPGRMGRSRIVVPGYDVADALKESEPGWRPPGRSGRW